MMMFETSKHVPKTEKAFVVVFLKIIVSFVLTRPITYYLSFVYLRACLSHCLKLFYVDHASSAMVSCNTLDSFYCLNPFCFLSAWALIEVHSLRVFALLKDYMLVYVMAM